MFHLVVGDKESATRHALVAGETVVGRSASCDITIDDPSVSRRQARLSVAGSRCKLVDLDSTNGTLVNGDPVTESDVDDGDTVVFGDVPARIEWSAEDRLALTEDREIIESGATLFRPVGPPGGSEAPAGLIDARRLLAMMSEISRTLVKPQPLLTVLNRVVDLAFSAIPAERAFLLLTEEGSKTVVPRVARARDGSAMPRASVSRTIVDRVMNDHVAILAKDAQTDARLAGVQSVIASALVRSFMCVPLWNQDDVIGVFYVDNPFTKEFSAEDLDLFSALSDYAAVAIEQSRLTARVLEETRRRERLQRYHSPAVVDRILADTGETSQHLVAQERDISVIFCDVVGFTALSERVGPIDVGRILNRVFSRLADVIFEHEGTLDKFIGDAVMAVFGAPLEQPDHPIRAVRTALGMQRALADLNAQQPEQPIEVRIAINSGFATAGDIGSPKRREYTVLGDVVNTCARLQALVCQPDRIVLSRATYDRVKDVFKARSLGSHKIRGREAQIEVFELLV